MTFLSVLKVVYKTASIAFTVVSLIPSLTKHRDIQKALEIHEEVQVAIDTVKNKLEEEKEKPKE